VQDLDAGLDGPSPITFLVDLSGREQHLVGVRMLLPADTVSDGGRLVIATWTPGSYVVRDYVHHLQRLSAVDATGGIVTLEADGVSAWTVPPVSSDLTIDLEWYAYDLSVRTNHVDDHHALLVGAATFPALEHVRHHPHHVHLTGIDADHLVVSLLPGEGLGPYVAEDHAHLVDAAFEVGPLRVAAVDVHGVEHRIVWAGHGDGVDVRGLADDLGRLAHAAVALFDGDLPAPRYTVIAVDGEGGGLEHRDGAVVAFPPHATTDPERRRRIVGLLAHEHLHLWNVKRLRPVELVDPPLDRPALTPSLWIAEGWTSYYDRLLPARAGLATVAELLSGLDRLRWVVEQTPGTALQSLHDASRTAWTKHYRRDENSPNAGTDYYAHGALVAFELDLLLRTNVPEGDGLDAVLRILWRRFGSGGTAPGGRPPGYTEDDVLAALGDLGGTEVVARCRTLTTVPGAPDPLALVAAVGLRTEPDGSDPVPELGVVLGGDADAITLQAVLRGGPAWTAGVSGGDRLLAIDGETLTAAELPTVLRRHGVGTEITLMLRRGPRVLTRCVTLGPVRGRQRLVPDPTAPTGAREAFKRWSGLAFPDASA
jgi:predicted metalloprotease with PDZ domain